MPSTQLTSTGVDSRACDFDLGELEQSLYPAAMRMIGETVLNLKFLHELAASLKGTSNSPH
jgi:hypothetical protein